MGQSSEREQSGCVIGVQLRVFGLAPKLLCAWSGGSAVYGQAVSLVATVTTASGAPTGTVTFSAAGKTLGTVALNSSGTATLSTSSLGLGSNAITATYNGSTNLGTATSGSVSESLAQAGTKVVLTPQSVRKGKRIVRVWLEAEVEPQAPSAGDAHRHGDVRADEEDEGQGPRDGDAQRWGGHAQVDGQAHVEEGDHDRL